MRLDSTSTSSSCGDAGGFSVIGDPNFDDSNFGDPNFGDPIFGVFKGDPGLGLMILNFYKFMVGDVKFIDNRVSSINLTPDQNTRGIGNVNFYR